MASVSFESSDELGFRYAKFPDELVGVAVSLTEQIFKSEFIALKEIYSVASVIIRQQIF